MDFWGFERRDEMPGDGFGLFEDATIRVRGGTGGVKGGGGAGGAKKAEDAIPLYRADPLTADDIDTAAARGERHFHALFQQMDKKGKPDKTQYWVIPGTVRWETVANGQIVPGLGREGARQIIDHVRGQEFSNSRGPLGGGLFGIDPAPEIFVYGPDGADSDSNPDVTRIPFRSLELFAQGETAASGSADGVDGGSIPGLDFVLNPNRTNEKKLDEDQAAAVALIQELLAKLLAGDVDVLGALIDALRMAQRVVVARAGARVAKGLAKAMKEMAANNKKLVETTKNFSKDSSQIAERNGEIQDLNFTNQQIRDFVDGLGNSLKTLAGLDDSLKNLSDWVHDWKSRQASRSLA